MEMSWGLHGNWAVRTDEEPAEGAALIDAFLTNGAITMHGDNAFMPAGAIAWTVAALPAEADHVRTMCVGE